MKHGIPTTNKPDDPNKIYMRNLYHEFFWGGFDNEEEVVKAINHLDKVDPNWNYNSFCLIYGASPLPDDFVFGFPFLPDDMQERIRNR